MKLSFIVVNYRSREYLAKCISSVFEFVRGVEFEIVVINNDLEKLKRNALIEEFAKDCFQQNLRIIEVNENIGFGRGCNIGAREASGEILCFLNPDTEIISKNIKNVLEEFDQDKKTKVIGSKLVDENGKVQKWITGSELTLWQILKNNFGYNSDKKTWLTNEKQKVAWVTGAVLFIKKDLFNKIEGFDKRFFMYFEDIDLCKRVRLRGFNVLYFPTFVVRHICGGSTKNHIEKKVVYYRSQDYYFQKWLSRGSLWLLKFLRILQKK